jgi:hypothetical protein
VVTSFLTNQELIAHLTLREDLTDLEQNLLDRLILAHDECERLEKEVTRLQPPAASAAPAG